MSSQNVAMPLFGQASGSSMPTSDAAWNHVDNFDVDMLAAYLLEDNPNITFDFNLSGDPSNTVSPEHSEDGVLPPVAEMGGEMGMHPGAVVAQQQQPQQALSADAYGLGTNQVKRRRMDNNSNGAPILAVASGAPPASLSSALFSGQPQQQQQLDLAAAAAQALQNSGSNKKKSQAQMDRRRERNRILAKRTRLRKKFFFESLQNEVMDLQRENARLKGIVQEEVGGADAKQLLQECDAMEKLPPSVMEACYGDGETDMQTQDASLVRSIQQSQHSFVITDPSLADNPIVFASDDFLALTGYTREQVLGRNCRFLQGTETSPEAVEKIRKGLAKGDDVDVTFLNYTADGTPFWNKLFIAALRDAQNNVVNYIGVVVKVPEPKATSTKFAVAGEEEAESTIKAIEGVYSAAIAAAQD